MTIPAPPSLTPAPSPAPTRADPANFRPRGDAYHSWLVPHVNTELPAVLIWIQQRNEDVVASAAAAAAGAAAAQESRTICQAAQNDPNVKNASANAAAAAARVGAEAAWTAALAANPDLDPVIRMNPSVVRANTTIPAGYNAYSAGPLEIADGAAVDIAHTGNWTIL